MSPEPTPPTVISTDPVSNATGVALNKTIAIVFSVPMDSTTITATQFTVRQGVTPVPGTVSHDGATVGFTPTHDLQANVTYVVSMAAGVKNLAGTALASAYVWSFTTDVAATPAPGTALIDKLKRELGTRNVAKYFAGADGLADLQDFVSEGIEALAAGKPMPKSATVTVEESVKEVEAPAGIKLVTEVYLEDEKLDPVKDVAGYVGDRYEAVFDYLVENPRDEYPGRMETQTFGDWSHDLIRNVVKFPKGVVGSLKMYGFGIPTESELSKSDKRLVLLYALSRALSDAIPKMLAAYDIDIDGAALKEKTDEYMVEAKRLMEEFRSSATSPFASFGR